MSTLILTTVSLRLTGQTELVTVWPFINLALQA